MVCLMAVLQISAATLLGFAQHAGVGGCALHLRATYIRSLPLHCRPLNYTMRADLVSQPGEQAAIE